MFVGFVFGIKFYAYSSCVGEVEDAFGIAQHECSFAYTSVPRHHHFEAHSLLTVCRIV